MQSIKELYKQGHGPSSSHTMAPLTAANEFLARFPNVDYIKVILYGSLALTGKGHLTDYIIEKTLMPIPCQIIFDYETVKNHPNTLEFYGYKGKALLGKMTVYSVGGGRILIDGEEEKLAKNIYPYTKFKDVAKYCQENGMTLVDYVDKYEENDLNLYLDTIFETMLNSVKRGLANTGVLPGKLEVKRKAAYIYQQNIKDASEDEYLRKKVLAYAYATSEENAAGGLIVTAPTCGASGVMPACLQHALDLNRYSHETLIAGLKVAGLIGNIVKTNGSISGAEAGCQAEVGTACAMAAAFMSYINGGNTDNIERAAEIALEHHLGLTCDPIGGYVQIPCIERNAVAALRAIDAAKLASYITSNDAKISFDLVVDAMLETGRDLKTDYRETAAGGLASKYH